MLFSCVFFYYKFMMLMKFQAFIIFIKSDGIRILCSSCIHHVSIIFCPAAFELDLQWFIEILNWLVNCEHWRFLKSIDQLFLIDEEFYGLLVLSDLFHDHKFVFRNKFFKLKFICSHLKSLDVFVAWIYSAKDVFVQEALQNSANIWKALWKA